MRRSVLVLTLAAATAAPALALADPPPPKVCVVVAGDPDEVVRAGAAALDRALALRSDVRVVADEAVRSALRGEPGDASVADIAAQRRGLHADDSDGLTLDALGHRLGCVMTAEIVSRPEGLWSRRYDVLHHAFVDDGRVHSADGVLASDIAMTARQVVDGTLQVAWGLAANARLEVRPVAPVIPSANAPTPAPAPVHPPEHGLGVLPWAIAGGAALALIAVFIGVQASGPGTPVITVTHGATSNSP